MTSDVLHPFRIAVASEGAGWDPASWREPDAGPEEEDLFSSRYWVDLVPEGGTVVGPNSA